MPIGEYSQQEKWNEQRKQKKNHSEYGCVDDKRNENSFWK